MADLSDVEIALTAQVVSALYPSGLAFNSALGVNCRIYRGWPGPSALNADLAAGAINATIFPARELDKIDDPYLNCEVSTIPLSELTVMVDNDTILFSGGVTLGILAGVLADNSSFIYQTSSGDTPASIAASLAGKIRPIRPVVYSGASLSIPGTTTLIARTQQAAVLTRASRRLRRDLHVALWCPNPSIRDAAAKTVDTLMSTKSFIELSDGTACHVLYRSSQVYDQSQNANLYRRDLIYCCEYVTTTQVNAPLMMFGQLAQATTHYV